jgi:hypothetical protein
MNAFTKNVIFAGTLLCYLSYVVTFKIRKVVPVNSNLLYAASTQNQEMLGSSTPRNLKTAPGNPIKDKLTTWKELKGLSEKDLLTPGGQIVDRSENALKLAYRRCEYVTNLFSKTFYMGTTLMRPDARQHVWAIYAWCRRTDDIVDSPRALLNRETLTKDLQEWERRLERIWSNQPVDLFDLAMTDTVREYPRMDIQPYRDMIKGMVMDVPGMGKDRYENFDELYTYCYRVAGTVGLMTLPILGTAKGVSHGK